MLFFLAVAKRTYHTFYGSRGLPIPIVKSVVSIKVTCYTTIIFKVMPQDFFFFLVIICSIIHITNTRFYRLIIRLNTFSINISKRCWSEIFVFENTKHVFIAHLFVFNYITVTIDNSFTTTLIDNTYYIAT